MTRSLHPCMLGPLAALGAACAPSNAGHRTFCDAEVLEELTPQDESALLGFSADEAMAGVVMPSQLVPATNVELDPRPVDVVFLATALGEVHVLEPGEDCPPHHQTSMVVATTWSLDVAGVASAAGTSDFHFDTEGALVSSTSIPVALEPDIEQASAEGFSGHSASCDFQPAVGWDEGPSLHFSAKDSCPDGNASFGLFDIVPAEATTTPTQKP